MDLINDLRPLSLADYERAIESYTDECTSITGVRGVYQFGSIGAPGLSDIDLVVVLDDEKLPATEELARLSVRHERWRRDSLIQACFIHDVFVCPKSIFEQVEWLNPGNRWTWRGGSEEHFAALTPEDRQMVTLVHGLDFCVARLHEFSWLDSGVPRSMRAIMPQLWSLTHTHRILVEAGAALEQTWDEVIQALSALRAEGVEHLRADRVASLMPTVVAHFVVAVQHFASLLEDRAELGVRSPSRECSVALHASRVLHVYARGRSNGARTRSAPMALTRHIRFAGRTVEAAWRRLDLPGTVLTHHMAYLAFDKRQSELRLRISKRSGMPIERSGSVVYQRTVSQRSQLARRTDDVLRPRGAPVAWFRIPGLPAPASAACRGRGTWRFRALSSWLDWRLLPAGVVGAEG